VDATCADSDSEGIARITSVADIDIAISRGDITAGVITQSDVNGTGRASKRMTANGRVADLANREHAIRWFLVDLWNLAGKAFLAAMAGDLLGKRTESVSDRSQVEQLASERTS
jgi:hypothetical protein